MRTLVSVRRMARCVWPIVLLTLSILAGCTPPTPVTATLPSEAVAPATAQPVPPTPLATATPLVGQAPIVPVLYKMFDWGTDLQKTNPEWGPVGSIQFVLWEQVNPEKGMFDWGPIDRALAKEAALKVTLPDGREIPKPVVIQVFPYISSAENWDAEYYDATPRWVYDQIDAENPNDPRPIVQERKVGHKLEGCDKIAVLPMFDSPTWRQAYYEMVRAFGARYNAHPQVTSIVVNTGLDGETQPVKDLRCPWNEHLDAQAKAVRESFDAYIQETMTVYREAFPNKTIFINNAPGGSAMRKMTSDFAASLNPPIGLKHSGMWTDLDSHEGSGSFYGSWDLIRAYSQTLPIWLESPFGLGSPEDRYWSLIAGLHYHPVAIDLHPEYFKQSDPAWLRFAVQHLGVTLADTPDVWAVLRDTEFEPQARGATGTSSGHMGNWFFWLYEREDALQSDTARVWRKEMPAAQGHVFSRQARRTQQDQNNAFMSFDIDDGYPYVNQPPIAAGGDVSFVIDVTLLNHGNDTFALQYRDQDGGMVSQTRQKGPALGQVDDWVTVSFVVRDGLLNNNMPGNVDFRLSCERDGDEYVHRVRVEGHRGEPTTPTPAARATAIPTQATPASVQAAPPATLAALPGARSYEPVADTFLDQWAPEQSPYELPKLSARQGSVRAPLLQFDLSAIPADAVVERAVLSLSVMGRTNPGTLEATVHPVLRAWKEAEGNWQQAAAGQPWAAAGCNDPQADFGAPAAQITLNTDSGWVEWDVTGLVQGWVREPQTNHGLVIKADGNAAVQYDFFSAQHPGVEVRPRLWVQLRGAGQ